MVINLDKRRLNHPKKPHLGLYFIVYGAASCHWTETESYETGTGNDRRTETRTIHYDGKDVYLDQKTYLFTSQDGKAVVMASGTYRYDFMFQLPHLLPASLESAHGSIRYHIEAVLDVPWRFDKKFKLAFTVVRHDDLNLQPELRIASTSEEIKRFCCFFCQSEPLMMTVTVPQTGYTPGQSILVTVFYNNQSDVEVARTKISLKRRVHHTR